MRNLSYLIQSSLVLLALICVCVYLCLFSTVQFDNIEIHVSNKQNQDTEQFHQHRDPTRCPFITTLKSLPQPSSPSNH